MGIFRRGIAYIKGHGMKVTLQKMASKTGERIFKRYHYRMLKNTPDKAELSVQRTEVFNDAPFISVVVPVYNTKPFLLKELMDSVLAQTYSHFELVLLDGASALPETRQALNEASGRDRRIKLYRTEKNWGISGNTNLGISKASGDYIALLDHDDLLTPDALYHVALAIVNQKADFIYSDEDKVSYNGRYFHTPHYKPDFSPDKLRACNYICHLMVIKKTLLDEAGMLDSRFDGSQDHELSLRLTEKAQKIVHIPRVLYHWRDVKTSMSRQNLQKCVDAATLAVREHVNRLGYDAVVTMEDMRAHVRFKKPQGTGISVIISGGGYASKIERLKKELGGSCRIIMAKDNLSRFASLNEAAAHAKGDVLLFINSGIECLTPNEIDCLIGRAVMADAGVVAPSIFYPDGTLRHQGYLVGMEHIVANPQKRHHMSTWGYFAIERMSHNISAASVAFMAVRRDVFNRVGGFDESYLNDLADVDFCLKVLKMGLFNVVLPDCKAVYHRPETGPEAIVDKRPNEKDAERFLKAYGVLNDPFYNLNWSKKGNGYKL